MGHGENVHKPTIYFAFSIHEGQKNGAVICSSVKSVGLPAVCVCEWKQMVIRFFVQPWQKWQSNRPW